MYGDQMCQEPLFSYSYVAGFLYSLINAWIKYFDPKCKTSENHQGSKV